MKSDRIGLKDGLCPAREPRNHLIFVASSSRVASATRSSILLASSTPSRRDDMAWSHENHPFGAMKPRKPHESLHVKPVSCMFGAFSSPEAQASVRLHMDFSAFAFTRKDSASPLPSFSAFHVFNLESSAEARDISRAPPLRGSGPPSAHHSPHAPESHSLLRAS